MTQDTQHVFLLVAFTSVLTVTISAWWILKKRNKSSLTPVVQKPKPEKWVKVGKVKKLIIYPIKSCQGVEVEQGVVTTLGLQFSDHNIKDRDFMIVDKLGRMQTLTPNPGMSFITMQPDRKMKNHLILSAPGMDSITFTFPDPKTTEERLCKVKHDAQVKALDCGDKVAIWIQTFLAKADLRLYYHHIQKTQRTFEPYMLECPMFEHSDMGTFHNETSYLMVSEESIDDLNTRLDKASSWKNWRPTILIDQVQEPFAEVNWSYVRIGNENGILKAAVPCYRCPLTTVDQETGVLPKDGEPLKTLRSMNKSTIFADKKVSALLNNKGIMGLRLGLFLPAGEGAKINVGDDVYAALL